ncbi:NADH-quinone oxidoreductase subunit NuoH [Haliscomenobacter hydrossis]|uniref:NADH-quinone oxidoreductase subunit H n=1 Tax=Haliscomenobacter hydrossis (strain ATCC 27775 / DSM 1100 / LMG 10767 / O) TaxID=760192 RepID=F4KW37_HALH1|nr:NADH-quinone oxidoreductase subunit NuoH [Haliscomenobacter hydrossis]AEE48235.1 NAD(P)H-quinone oxidoreductase subunit 1 [Haliscomenobacter hydrossis DSM 1100]
MILLSILLFKTGLAFTLFLITLGIAAYSTYFERKVAAFMQDRVGPNRAGPLGLLQPIADGVKMIFKEEHRPTGSNRILFILGPSIAMLTALMTTAVVPWGKTITIGGTAYSLQVADINVGILYVFGVVSLGVYGILIGGWSSNNKYSLLGAVRASSQMISYELAMGLSIIPIILGSSSLQLSDIVTSQYEVWNIFKYPLGFLIFLICAFAETNRTPFDLPECETELVGGYHTEYTSMKLGFFLFSEYVNMFASSAVISTLFFGGYHFPGMSLFPEGIAAILGIAVLFGKIIFFIFFFMWIRWTIPRFRYDQLMHLGWQVLMPMAILLIVIYGAIFSFI